MTELLGQALTQWGAAGMIAIGAGYVLWDSWKRNKKTEEWLHEQIKSSNASHHITQDGLADITKSITDVAQKMLVLGKAHSELRDQHNELRQLMTCRLDEIEAKMDEMHPDIDAEAERLSTIIKIMPAVHHLIQEGLDYCNCDHIAIGMLHNGTKSLSGVPYIKFDILTEAYRPIRHPQDIELISKYKNESIMSHNKLPMVISQNEAVIFDIMPNSPLMEIDNVLYNKCKSLEIKKIAFIGLRSGNESLTGFLVAYKFDESDFDEKSLNVTTKNIEHIYKSMIDSFQKHP